MLNSGRKFRALRDKKINILTLVLSEENFLNETKNLIRSIGCYYGNNYCVQVLMVKY